MLEDLGNIGDFIGGVGVAVTLVYLAIQIRSNAQQVQVEEHSRLLGLQAHQSVGERTTDVLFEVAKNVELFQIWTTGFNNFREDRDPQVVERYGMILHRLFMSMEDAENFSEYDERVRERIERLEIHWIRNPSVQDWWSRQRIAYSDSFRSRIDERIRQLNAGE
jgi:DNA-binding Lrp family transcriptional regulator